MLMLILLTPLFGDVIVLLIKITPRLELILFIRIIPTITMNTTLDEILSCYAATQIQQDIFL